MAHAKRVAVPLHASPQRCIREDQEKVPWATIVILILVLVVVLALWGKLPSRLNQLHQAPRGNAPGVSHLSIDSPSNFRLA
jgi:hypothetical protein